MAKAIVSGNEADHTQEIAQLKAIIRRMDQTAQQALGHIGDVAELALLALESPRGQKEMTKIAAAFQLVSERAFGAWFDISNTASTVGCAHFDEQAVARCEARQVALDASRESVHG